MTMLFYARNGQQHGPHQEEEIRALFTQGKLAADELVWREGMHGWAPLRSVLDLGPAGAAPHPPPAPPGAYYYAGPYQAAPGFAPAQKQRSAYVLLGVFLGSLGIHNFYAGYTGKAVAQLLITLFLFWLILPLVAVWIWTVVEVATVTHDAQGFPMA